MTWYAIYDLTTGQIESTAAFQLDDEAYATQGRGQVSIADGQDVSGMKVDLTTLQLVPNDSVPQ